MNHPVYRLVWRTLLWVLPCFLVWYWLGDVHVSLTGMLVRELVDMSFPVKVQMWEHYSSLVFEIPLSTGQTNADGSLLILGTAKIEIDVLQHGVGLPLFIAMMLGTPDASGRDLSIPVGVGILLAYEFVVVYCFVILGLIRVLHSLGVDTPILFGLSWHPQIISLALVLGKLVLPTFLAIVLWAVFNRRFIDANFLVVPAKQCS